MKSTQRDKPEDIHLFRYVLAGNIIDQHHYGENKEIRRGTKQFRPGAKVYLLPLYGGGGHAEMPVYGLPRRSRRKIVVVIRAVLIKNVRLQKTYDPSLVVEIDRCGFYTPAMNDEKDLIRFAKWINDNHIEITG